MNAARLAEIRERLAHAQALKDANKLPKVMRSPEQDNIDAYAEDVAELLAALDERGCGSGVPPSFSVTCREVTEAEKEWYAQRARWCIRCMATVLTVTGMCPDCGASTLDSPPPDPDEDDDEVDTPLCPEPACTCGDPRAVGVLHKVGGFPCERVEAQNSLEIDMKGIKDRVIEASVMQALAISSPAANEAMREFGARACTCKSLLNGHESGCPLAQP